jgi:AcrR family transcriptional regulator
MQPPTTSEEIVPRKISEPASGTGADSRRRILEAALDVGAERGYDGTTIELVSRRSSLPASSIYWFFGSKDRLLAEAITFGMARFQEEAGSMLADTSGMPPAEAIHERLRWGAQVVMSRPGFWQLGLMLALAGQFEEPEARNRFMAASLGRLDGLVDWWTSVLPEQLSDPARARAVAASHLAILNGFYVARAAGQGAELSELAELVARGLVRAVIAGEP